MSEESAIVVPSSPSVSRFGKGYKPDTHDKSNDVPLRALLGAPVRVPTQASLEQYVTAIYDQGQTSSCVGWAFAQAIATRCRVAGTPIAFPSPVAIYTGARAFERSQDNLSADVPLQDNGCSPQLAVKGMTIVGVPSNVIWPFDEKSINEAPDALKLEAASQFILKGYYRIDSGDATRLNDIRHGIASGFPIAFGTQVDDAFEDYKTGVLGAPKGKLLGGHMMHVIAYYSDGTFLIVNQWARSWGMQGMAKVSGDFFTCPQMGDLVALDCSASGH